MGHRGAFLTTDYNMWFLESGGDEWRVPSSRSEDGGFQTALPPRVERFRDRPGPPGGIPALRDEPLLVGGTRVSPSLSCESGARRFYELTPCRLRH